MDYEDFSASGDEWEPYGGWPDPTLNHRDEDFRRHANLIKRHHKTKAWEATEATRRGHEAAIMAPNHVIEPIVEGIVNSSGILEAFNVPVAPGQQLVFHHTNQVALPPDPEPTDDATFHSSTTQPRALIGFIMHGGDEDAESLANSNNDSSSEYLPSLHQREDSDSSDEDDNPDDTDEETDVDEDDDIPWVPGNNGRTRRRLQSEDGSYALPTKVATTYGLCQSALTWMSLKDRAGQL